MPRKENKTSYELGRRLVKGPRTAVPRQAAAGDKYATGHRRRYHHRHPKRHQKNTPPRSTATFNVLQVNVGGLKNRKIELAKMLSTNKVHIALVQETLHASCNIHITGYTPYPCKCTGCQGTITYIRNDVTAECDPMHQHDGTDVHKINACFGNNTYVIYNVYSPPGSTCHINDIQESVHRKTIIAGDFNGHSPLWGYPDTNKTREYLEVLNQSTNLIITQNSK